MSFFKKLTQTLLSPFLTPSKPTKKSERAPAKKSPKVSKAVKAKAKKSAAAKTSKKKPLKAQKTTLKARNTKKAVKSQAKPKTKPAPKGKQARKAGGGGKVGKKAPEAIPGTLIAHVTHFFPQVNAAAMKIESGTLEVGDEVYFKGATTDFKMKILSMQINRVPVTSAGKGAEIGILSKKRVREGDAVYKLS